jgi:hypothetical protein
MENPSEKLLELLIQNNITGLRLFIEDLTKTLSWNEIITLLRKITQSLYGKHWLKTQHIILSIFNIPELTGVDSDIFHELSSIRHSKTITHASNILFGRLKGIINTQFKKGGSTLFFNVEKISSTKSAVILSELIQARSREALFVLEEIDGKIPELTNEWVDVTRLWKTSNGFRLLKARNLSTHIHIREYSEIRDRLTKEMNIESDRIPIACDKLRVAGYSHYLQFSKPLDEFVMGLIASLGIRGTFDPYYKTWIDHEGLDEF